MAMIKPLYRALQEEATLAREQNMHLSAKLTRQEFEIAEMREMMLGLTGGAAAAAAAAGGRARRRRQQQQPTANKQQRQQQRGGDDDDGEDNDVDEASPSSSSSKDVLLKSFIGPWSCCKKALKKDRNPLTRP